MTGASVGRLPRVRDPQWAEHNERKEPWTGGARECSGV
jgi:hypothetical protein